MEDRGKVDGALLCRKLGAGMDGVIQKVGSNAAESGGIKIDVCRKLTLVMKRNLMILYEIMFGVDDGINDRVAGEYRVAPLLHLGKIGVKLLDGSVGMSAAEQHPDCLKLVNHIVAKLTDHLGLLLQSGIILCLAFQQQLRLLLVQLQLMELAELLKGVHQHIVHDDDKRDNDTGTDGKGHDCSLSGKGEGVHINQRQQNGKQKGENSA